MDVNDILAGAAGDSGASALMSSAQIDTAMSQFEKICNVVLSMIAQQWCKLLS